MFGKSMSRESFKGIVIDNTAAETHGTWTSGAGIKGFIDADYIYISGQSKGYAKFPVKVKKDGLYEVRISYTPHENRSKNATVTITSLDGEKSAKVNQQSNPTHDKIFVSLGKFHFGENQAGFVTILSGETQGNVVADAVQLIPVAD